MEVHGDKTLTQKRLSRGRPKLTDHKTADPHLSDNQEFLAKLVGPITQAINECAIDTKLEKALNERFPPSSELFKEITEICHRGSEEGWMCTQGSEGRWFGRVLEPSAKTCGLSVDVVDLTEIVGPHHLHPTGEICMVMPVTPKARFDGYSAGWCVNPPGSGHNPTVKGGRAFVLYFLPGGEIEFT